MSKNGLDSDQLCHQVSEQLSSSSYRKFSFKLCKLTHNPEINVFREMKREKMISYVCSLHLKLPQEENWFRLALHNDGHKEKALYDEINQNLQNCQK